MYCNDKAIQKVFDIVMFSSFVNFSKMSKAKCFMFAVLGCRAIVSTQKYYYDTMTVIVLDLSNFFSILQISTVQD